MTGLILLSMVIVLCILMTLWYRAEMQRAYLQDRLGYGFAADVADATEDLAAGDYGLEGKEQFYFYLKQFFESWQGRVFLFGLGAGVASLLTLFFEFDTKQIVIIVLAGGLSVLALAMTLLFSRRRKVAYQVQSELPNALEIIAALMEGGMAFESSLAFLLQETDKKHPLYFDLEVVREAMQRGRRRADALRLWVQRCNLPAVVDITAALIQAEQTSAALGSILRHHAEAMQRHNEGEIQRRAERLPIRMLLPMVLTILPSVIIVAALPSLLKIVRVIEDVMSR